MIQIIVVSVALFLVAILLDLCWQVIWLMVRYSLYILSAGSVKLFFAEEKVQLKIPLSGGEIRYLKNNGHVFDLQKETPNESRESFFKETEKRISNDILKINKQKQYYTMLLLTEIKRKG